MGFRKNRSGSEPEASRADDRNRGHLVTEESEMRAEDEVDWPACGNRHLYA
ncbi:hypothetical protein [Paenibacillus faecalis]|uniref:hypothetical protein n=1 Tax=Paenibacillus faecalis TaxID=2079532 RepID=UPI00131A570B|nr:hypothetical protein [Paenibacillus faecalis]